MEWVETTGKSVEEALDRALDELGVDETDAEYEVLAEPKAGLFGRIKGEARVRARVKPVSREKPGERRRRRGEGRNRSGRGRGRGDGERARAGRGDATAPTDGGRASGEGGGPGATGSPSRRRRSRRRRGSGGRPGSDPATEQTGEPDQASANEDEGAVVEDDVRIEEQAETALRFTEGLVDAFGADATVSTTVDAEDEHVLVEVVGSELGLLVGPRGATLAAVEELVRTAVQRSTSGHGVRINVDVAGYREKRRAALTAFAQELAEKVRETGVEHALEPMSPADRKVVHDAVAELDGVGTASEGDEPRRRVVIHRED